MASDLVVELLGEAVNRGFEAIVFKWRHAAAVVADEMVMVVAVGIGRLIANGALA